MISQETIENIINQWIGDRDIFIANIEMRTGNKIDISLDSMGYVNIDQCIEVNRLLRSELGEIADDYEITVGSFGMDKAFKSQKQYIKNLNREVKVVTLEGKEIKGILKKFEDDNLTILPLKESKKKGQKLFAEETVAINLNQIKETKRIITF